MSLRLEIYINYSTLRDQTVINFGATVQLLNLANNQTAFFTLLSEYEVDVLNNVISVLSPLGFQLMGKVVGDIIEVTIPKGQIEYECLMKKRLKDS